MGIDFEENHVPTDKVELISDGDNLLILGGDRSVVEAFLRSRGLLGVSREVKASAAVSALRFSADAVQTLSESVAASGLWLKLTPESAAAIKDFGMTPSGVRGVSYAMAGRRGDIKGWLKVEKTIVARASNPAIISTVAGVLSQSARQQEVAQLNELLQHLDLKLAQVLRGQRDEVLGDLGGIEREIQAGLRTLTFQGSVDSLTWSKLSGASLQIRQVQEKALLKLRGVAEDLERHKRVKDLNAELPEAKDSVQLWLSVIARCTKSLDQLAILELDYYFATAPHLIDDKRVSLDASRQDDLAQIHQGVAGFVERMDSAANMVNQHKLFHIRGVPEAITSIEDARGSVRRLHSALDTDVDLKTLLPTQLSTAVRQWSQWSNGLAEGGSATWKVGKPVLGAAVLSLVARVVKDKISHGQEESR